MFVLEIFYFLKNKWLQLAKQSYEQSFVVRLTMQDMTMKVPDTYADVGGVHNATCLLVYLLNDAIRYRPPPLASALARATTLI